MSDLIGNHIVGFPTRWLKSFLSSLDQREGGGACRSVRGEGFKRRGDEG